MSLLRLQPETLHKLLVRKQICQAVAYLHNLKLPVIHRHIKPVNVIVAKVAKTFKLCDMGLMKFKSAQSVTQTTSISIHGTPCMALECLVERRKVWSLTYKKSLHTHHKFITVDHLKGRKFGEVYIFMKIEDECRRKAFC